MSRTSLSTPPRTSSNAQCQLQNEAASQSGTSTQRPDIESKRRGNHARRIPPWRRIFGHTAISDAVYNYRYRGSGVETDPYLVEWIENDPHNPMNFPLWKKWFITITMAIATLAVSFCASAYTGAIEEVLEEFGSSEEVGTLGVSLFVLGFAVGPLLWAPLSELYGRQSLFVITYAGLTAFNAGAAGSNSMATLIVLRFFAGAIGSSPLTNAGGVIADMFPASQRGLGMTVFASAPFLGPTIGPIVGGFAGESIGWRWVEGIMAIFTGVLWIFGSLTVPETYAPLLLRKRAELLSRERNQVYISILERNQKTTPAAAFKKALARPWVLLFVEPIVLILSIYMAILYGTLFMFFGAFPIVYQQGRGWSQGIGGLAFIGVATGMLLGITFAICDNRRYARTDAAYKGQAPPEARLPPCMVGAVLLPVGLFWFSWTNSPSIHWIVSIIAAVPFGFGMVVIMLGGMNYLVDSYTVYAASVLAANAVLRSLFGAAFPLFTTQMYDRLGIHWASSLPGFLTVACLPFPFLFYRYGEKIRMKCKYTAQAHEMMQQMREAQKQVGEPVAPGMLVEDDTEKEP